MTPHQTTLADALRRIAPEIDIAEVDQSADLREEFDIDSMDFLKLVTALSEHYGIEMPEADYGQMSSFSALADYLARHAG